MLNSDIAALGNQIRSARKKADLTQEQLSALCHVSTKHIANIEKGIMNPSYEILLAKSTRKKCNPRNIARIAF